MQNQYFMRKPIKIALTLLTQNSQIKLWQEARRIS